MLLNKNEKRPKTGFKVYIKHSLSCKKSWNYEKYFLNLNLETAIKTAVPLNEGKFIKQLYQYLLIKV